MAGNLGIDSHAYYCAARAQRLGTNPYFAASLAACEHDSTRGFYRPPGDVTVPAPYPPYALALFAPLTVLPFATAAVTWWILLAIALLLTAFALARITAQPWLVGWATIVLSAGLTSFSGGNAMPVALAALCLGALAVVRSRPTLAAIALAFAMVEPHVALPAAIALFVGYPAARLPLALALGMLGGLSIAAGGAAQTLGYVFTVIPAHALSEVSRDNQYSLSTVVAALGAPDSAAAIVGTISYVLMLAIGIVVGIVLARRFNEPAIIVLVPPAFSLLGGSFVHVTEISAALPAALLIFTQAKIYRAWLFAAVILLAVPWLMAGSAASFLAPAFPVAYLTYVLWCKERQYVLFTAVLSFAAIYGLFTIDMIPWPHPTATHAYPPMDPRLAEVSWRALVLGNSTNRPAMWLVRLPTWIGLMAFLIPAPFVAPCRGRRAAT